MVAGAGIADVADRKAHFWARASGFLLIYYIGAASVGGLILGSFNTSQNFSETAARIVEGEAHYRLGLLIRLSADLTAIAVGFTLWALLRRVDAELAFFALLWRVAEGVIGCVAALFRSMRLGLAERAAVIDADAPALLASASNSAFALGVLLFAIGSLLFFMLLARTDHLPRWLSWIGVVGSICALLLALVLMLSPEPIRYVEALWAPLAVAEVVGGLILLVRGAGRQGGTAAAVRPDAP